MPFPVYGQRHLDMARQTVHDPNQEAFRSMLRQRGIGNPHMNMMRNQAIDVGAGRPAPAPEFHSDFGHGLVAAQNAGVPAPEPLNARGLGGFQPSGRGPNQGALQFAQQRLLQRSVARELGGVQRAVVKPRTPLEMGILEREQAEKDRQVLSAARRHGLGPNIPAVALAMQRTQERMAESQHPRNLAEIARQAEVHQALGQGVVGEAAPHPLDEDLHKAALDVLMEHLKTLRSPQEKWAAIQEFRRNGGIGGAAAQGAAGAPVQAVPAGAVQANPFGMQAPLVPRQPFGGGPPVMVPRGVVPFAERKPGNWTTHGKFQGK